MATTLNVLYETSSSTGSPTAFAPFLELCLAQTNSQGAYLYRLTGDWLRLEEWSGRAPSEMERFEANLPHETALWHRENLETAFSSGEAWSDPRLERFPEFLRNRFETAASIPLVESGSAIGLLHVCRAAAGGYQPREAAFLRSLGLPLGSLLSHSAARVKLEGEVEALSRKLADRKLLDRAKGILQAAFQWAEEEAYLFLRRSSRQRRTPMREIALEVVNESLRAAQ